MPTFQTPKTYLQIFHTKLLKIIFKIFLENFSINVLQIKIYFYLCIVEKAKRYLKF